MIDAADGGADGARGDDTSWIALIDAATRWWAGAGVDCAFTDGPRNWLAQPAAGASHDTATNNAGALEPQGRKPSRIADAGEHGSGGRTARRAASPPTQDAAAVPEPFGGPRASWPETLEAFAPWWLASPALGTGARGPRVPPSGPARPKLMIVIREPEREDKDRLLSGEDGALLDAMLRAIGLARDECYIASVLPVATPFADWSALAERGLGAVLRHHVGLVRPKALLVFSRDAAALLAPEVGNKEPASIVPAPAQESGAAPLLASHSLSTLRERPMLKRSWWRRWLAFSHSA